ncbi:MAG: FAD:protein FMN transferase [Phocaeicola sp.]
MNKKKLIWQLLFLAVLVVGTILILKKQPPFRTDEGLVFGTIYKITYQSDESLKEEIENRLKEVDNSLSTFKKQSIITKVNQNEPVELDTHFVQVYNIAQRIAAETDGAYDITVAPLVNAWGFGFKHSAGIEAATIDSLKQFVGYKKIKLSDGKIVKEDKRTLLDCSSIAKGYGVDQVAQLLESKGIKNFLVDIGGEVVAKGKNPKMKLWRIGINKPIEDSLSINQELQTILEMSNIGMATSGNYRNFYYKDGKKYAHTINPLTGYPAENSLLSATVIAKDCTTADAYATAFMVMGIEKAEAFCKKHPELEVYFIYASHEEDSYQVFMTDGMKKLVVKL